ncbi:MAG TPA: sensor histidine kinase [Thermoanaerobaculia bacterium]|nr:sensor histidine kinase [Thermoanaerobaculia bacterium]
MPDNEALALEAHLGAELHRRSSELTREWLDRLLQRLELQPRRVFPSDTLLNHIPEILKGISDYLCTNGDMVAAELVRRELAQLARLRREQGYDVDELLAEFEILGEILYGALREEAGAFERKVPAEYAIEVAERLYRALMVVTTITAGTFREEGFRDRRERARLLGGFGRDLAHELRNRLAAADASLQILAHDLGDLHDGHGAADSGPGSGNGGAGRRAGERSQRALKALGSALQRIKGVADDVHALAIAQGSEESAQGRRLALRTLLEETVEELGGLAEEKGVRLELQDIIPDVQVDATRVELVLINLLGNAIKYSDQGKDDRWVRISVQRQEPAHWRIGVADNGVGIPSDLQGLVFEQFVRAHPEVADGTGLGLAIARAAIDQLQGEIWVESEPGAGSTFYFTVVDPPAASLPASASPNGAAP